MGVSSAHMSNITMSPALTRPFEADVMFLFGLSVLSDQ